MFLFWKLLGEKCPFGGDAAGQIPGIRDGEVRLGWCVTCASLPFFFSCLKKKKTLSLLSITTKSKENVI